MSIEERAKEFSSDIWYDVSRRYNDITIYRDNYEEEVKDAYIQGATDQHKIDIEKALKEVCRRCKYMLGKNVVPCDRFPCKMYNNMKQTIEE